ncbi:Ricin B-like lectin R40G3 [Rhynchospora pubera]|uniref:Ricin B-like lectin R40G3 n=1 Tax=Rhynchospora pubera TaxID=906938 RepID=A0AAV8F6J9_9POAL|nr:Ricin B-like lectin R40G3 [Rhynchospora pubera]
MEFPHERHHHHHGGGGDDDEERRPPPPEYGYGGPPPPRPEYGYGEGGYGHGEGGYGHGEGGYGHGEGRYGQGEGGYGHAPPPRQEYGHGDEGYGRPPPTRPEYGGGYGQPGVQHVSNVSHHQSGPHGHGGNDAMETLMRQPTYRIYCKANDGVCLAIRDGTVLLTTANESDLSQHWIKDLKYSTKVKDEEGYPAFALVNKATRQALKHSLGQSHPVQLMEYNPEKLEESVLWTESRDVGSGFRCIRMVNNIYLNFDAFHGDKDHGGVHDCTTVVLYEWCEGDNQRWKIASW